VPTAHERLPLGALRVFDAVASDSSFSGAADALNVTPAAVSQQIKSLEDYLQVPLFRRNGRHVEMTEEGLELLPGLRVSSRSRPRFATVMPRVQSSQPSGREMEGEAGAGSALSARP
jgi:hypothetical protein